MKKIKVPNWGSTLLTSLFKGSLSCQIMKKGPTLLILVPLTVAAQSCHSEKNNFTPERLTVIDKGKDFEVKDTFDCHQIMGVNYAESDTLLLKIDTDATVISAEKITHMYPTIWNDTDDELIQSVYLYDLGSEIKEELPVSDGIIVYPVGTPSDKTDTDNSFKAITKKQVTDGIDNIPIEYRKKNHLLSYEYENWTREAKGWKKIADRYRLEDFVIEPNEPFDNDPEMI